MTDGNKTFFGHPRGLFLLFLAEMWERFSYYGMRALLVLYLVHQTTGENPGRGWSKADASNLYGWYTGLTYLFPLLGGVIADKLIGTHRSMVVGAIIIALGHIALAISGFGSLVHSSVGMSVFIMGLALVIIGTGHFKPTVSVMVGQLYPLDDPRRDGAFTIFYMGINLGAFICAFVCGTLGEKVGWHWGFGSAAVGMIIGLIIYTMGKPIYLKGIGSAPADKPNYAPVFIFTAIFTSAIFALLYYKGFFTWLGCCSDVIMGSRTGGILIPLVVTAIVITWSAWFIARQEPDDRGPTACILMFMVFNAVFWLAFEQAGSSLNLFASEMTNRWIDLPFKGKWEIPATWFQSINPLVIILLGPLFATLWPLLGRRKLNPSQPMKIAIALLLVGCGYIFMVVGIVKTPSGLKAGMFWLFATYTLHTIGELCISPTGLSFVTRAAPVRYVSFLMGIWFLSSFVANKLGGTMAAQIERIEQGKLELFWYQWFKLGGQADFFLLFVISSVTAGILVLVLTPFLKKLLHGRE
ncbi:MAG: peptide MFS transporter [Kiritimatiellae bacterium]|nr:peptide MFS transporter [Kiritimatiellia bacterium]MDD5521555.1 peptide MFS transporter [Kiritimatiellia bacterium]